MFQKAERRKAKLRLGLCGPSGSGKTYSGLLVAKGLGGKIAVIDTEHRSAELYADLCDYDVAIIEAPYTVEKYITSIKEAEKLGYDTIIIDSLSHAWAGEGGILDYQGKVASISGKTSYTAWREATPKHQQLIEAMLQSKCHIIATMRTKQDYVLVENDKGKLAPQKVGMAPVQRDGMDYEFTLVFDVDVNHMAISSKDRTSMFKGNMPILLSEATGDQLLTWLNSGSDAQEQLSVSEKITLESMGLATPSIAVSSTPILKPTLKLAPKPAAPTMNFKELYSEITAKEELLKKIQSISIPELAMKALVEAVSNNRVSTIDLLHEVELGIMIKLLEQKKTLSAEPKPAPTAEAIPEAKPKLKPIPDKKKATVLKAEGVTDPMADLLAIPKARPDVTTDEMAALDKEGNDFLKNQIA